MATDTANLPIGNAPLEGNSTKQIEATVSASAKPDLPEVSAIITSSTLDSGSDDLKKEGDFSKSGKVSSAGSANVADVSDTEKKIRRAERFGITVQLSEEEKRNSRAERFGTAPGTGSGSTLNKSEELKRKARAERFGLPASVDEDAKKKSRLQRFAPASKTDPLEEEKKKAREFSQPQSNSLSMNDKGDIEQNAAIAGKAAGGT